LTQDPSTQRIARLGEALSHLRPSQLGWIEAVVDQLREKGVREKGVRFTSGLTLCLRFMCREWQSWKGRVEWQSWKPMIHADIAVAFQGACTCGLPERRVAT